MAEHHGMMNFANLNHFCTMESHGDERLVGMFGRMFPHLNPLYINPNELIKLGEAGGFMDGGNVNNPTQDVPLGFIFLGQFIDHDITFDTSSSLSSVNNPSGIENTRTANLDLDCIFGGGPEDEPFLYERATHKLLTGLTNNNIGQGPALEEHDLARNGQGRALIGDPRNDENRVVSQLQLMWIKLYNKFYDDIQASNPGLGKKEIYEEARREVTWHYQWIVINEFLPALCGDKIVDEILGSGRKHYCPGVGYIPVEFSVAAYRFGHSMISQRIAMKQGGPEKGLFNLGRSFDKVESLDEVVEWEAFFNFDNNYQRAKQLNTKIASVLLDLPFLAGAPPEDRSLATRNLRRGQSFLMPSGEKVAEALGRSANEIDDVVDFVRNGIRGINGLNLTQGIPMWLYILAEAEIIGKETYNGNEQGQGLGPAGATIVAEVLIGLMELDMASYLGSNRDWKPKVTHDNMVKLIEYALN